MDLPSQSLGRLWVSDEHIVAVANADEMLIC